MILYLYFFRNKLNITA